MAERESGQEQAPKVERPKRPDHAPEVPPVSRETSEPVLDVPTSARSAINAYHNRRMIT